MWPSPSGKVELDAVLAGPGVFLYGFFWVMTRPDTSATEGVPVARERRPLTTNQVLLVIGAGIVGTSAGDLITEAALAIEMGSDAADIGLTIHPHPTLSETVGMAAEAFEGSITDLYMPKKR